MSVKTKKAGLGVRTGSAKVKTGKKGHLLDSTRTTVLLLFLFGIGLCLIFYPSFADYWNSLHQSRAIMTYAENVSNMNKEEYEKIISSAEDYNTALAATGAKWTMTDEERDAYNAQLNIDDSGNMGYITIPKIDVNLPIYHGTSDAVLQTSIGHLEGTSLPVGGESSHCVLSGHRGLPSAKLFTDLDQLVEGDTFTLSILDQTYTYEVDQIRIVEPTDLSDLQIEKGKDYCTLVTCTPYGINTHRLLVRGHRVDNADGDAEVIPDAILIDKFYVIPFIAVPIIVVLVLIVCLKPSRNHEKVDYHTLSGYDRK